jgi:hypothetical protein
MAHTHTHTHTQPRAKQENANTNLTMNRQHLQDLHTEHVADVHGYHQCESVTKSGILEVAAIHQYCCELNDNQR